MKILVTGSSGMLGVDLGRVLSESGERQIFGLDIRPPAAASLPRGEQEARADKKAGFCKKNGVWADFIEADITQGPDLSEKIGRIRPELAIHTAAYTDVDGCQLNPERAEAVNALGAKNMALACKEAGSGLVYISTDYVFSGEKGLPYTEDDEPAPVNIYGWSKLNGENYVRSIVKKYLIIRSSWLFGLHGKNFVDAILAKAAEKIKGSDTGGKEIKVVSDQTGSPTYTLDLAGAIVTLIERVMSVESADTKTAVLAGENISMGFETAVPAGVYHITNSGSCSWYDFARKAVEYANLSGVEVKPIRADELEPVRPAPRPAMSALDNSRYNKLTGCPLRPWQDALLSYIKEKNKTCERE